MSTMSSTMGADVTPNSQIIGRPRRRVHGAFRAATAWLGVGTTALASRASRQGGIARDGAPKHRDVVGVQADAIAAAVATTTASVPTTTSDRIITRRLATLTTGFRHVQPPAGGWG